MPEQVESKWCADCGRMQPVYDEFRDGVQDYDGERAVWVVQFTCGHQTDIVSKDPHDFYPFLGG